MIAYFLIKHGTGPILWLINIVILCVVALIAWFRRAS